MSLAAIETLLRELIGLNPASLGADAVARAVRKRTADCGLPDEERYWDRLQTSAEEQGELVEEVVVVETWFFRGTAAFSLLGQYALDRVPSAPVDQTLRLLSFPCATGEEPYSMAMALLDAGLAPGDFQIDALDISQKALAKAQEALYSAHSFRGRDLDFRKRYFEPVPEGYRLRDPVKQTVRFRYGNGLEAQFLADRTPYDVIFCRNLLIYLEDSARERTVKRLHRALAPSGLLFVGAAETLPLLAPRFVRLRHPRAFAFRKVEEPLLRLPRYPAGEIVGRSEDRTSEEGGSLIRRSPARRPTPDILPSDARRPTPDEPAVQHSWLKKATLLADRGRLNEAAPLCEREIRENGPSARAYYLLGVIRQAQGNPVEAEECFHKALYLEPDHLQTLLHLSLLLEQRGDAAGAERTRKRARRVQHRRDSPTAWP